MPHPADFRDPGDLRAMMHGAYQSYASGQHLFPHLRIRTNPENLAKKTRPIAAALGRAWARIDEDQAYFDKAVEATATMVASGRLDQQSAVIITQIGRNAAGFASIRAGERLQISIGTFPAKEFMEELDGVEIATADGSVVSFQEGELDGEVSVGSGIIYRSSGGSGVFAPTPGQTVELISRITDAPISVVDLSEHIHKDQQEEE